MDKTKRNRCDLGSSHVSTEMLENVRCHRLALRQAHNEHMTCIIILSPHNHQRGCFPCFIDEGIESQKV